MDLAIYPRIPGEKVNKKAGQASIIGRIISWSPKEKKMLISTNQQKDGIKVEVLMGECNGEMHFKMGETIQMRGNCFADRKINGEQYTLLKSKLDDQTLNQVLHLMNNEYSHLFMGGK